MVASFRVFIFDYNYRIVLVHLEKRRQCVTSVIQIKHHTNCLFFLSTATCIFGSCIEALRPWLQCPKFSCNKFKVTCFFIWSNNTNTSAIENPYKRKTCGIHKNNILNTCNHFFVHLLHWVLMFLQGWLTQTPFLTVWPISYSRPLFGSLCPLRLVLEVFWYRRGPRWDPPWTVQCMSRADWQYEAAVLASFWPHCPSPPQQSLQRWGSSPALELRQEMRQCHKKKKKKSR